MICGLPLSIIWPFEIGTPFETTLDENYSVPCWLYWKQFLILHYKTNIIHLTACMSQKLIESKKDFFFEKIELARACPFDYFTIFCRLFVWLFYPFSIVFSFFFENSVLSFFGFKKILKVNASGTLLATTDLHIRLWRFFNRADSCNFPFCRPF